MFPTIEVTENTATHTQEIDNGVDFVFDYTTGQHVLKGLVKECSVIESVRQYISNVLRTPADRYKVYTEDESDNPYEEVFSIRLNRLPSEISELMFVVKSFRHEFSNHMVRLRFGVTQKQYDLPNKNKEIFTERVLIRLRRNNGWIAEVCEDFCDIESLVGNSNEKE